MNLIKVSVLSSILFLGVSVIGVSAAHAEKRTGEQIYQAHCSTCHDMGVANAPKTNDTVAWKARGKTTDQLLASSIKGLNAMPPKGLCMDCTDEELKAAIIFMTAEKKQ